MTQNVSWALQKSVYAALNASPEIVSRLGDSMIYDEIPRSALYPYVRFGQSVVRDYSTGSEEGSEHILTFHIWSKEKGRQEVFDIMEAMKTVLHDQSLVLVDHHLVNLRCEFESVRRESASQSCHGIVRYRVVTELLH